MDSAPFLLYYYYCSQFILAPNLFSLGLVGKVPKTLCGADDGLSFNFQPKKYVYYAWSETKARSLMKMNIRSCT